MTNVLFICTFNINRSPMAEAIFRHLVQEAGLAEKIEVSSVGISNYHVGQPLSAGTRKVLRDHHLAFDNFVARTVTSEDFQNHDYVIVMDEFNLDSLEKRGFPSNLPRLLDFAPELGMKNVPDPWVTKEWSSVYRLIETSCRNLLEHICETEHLHGSEASAFAPEDL